MIDFHNDQGGELHVSRPNVNLEPYLARMNCFEGLFREYTWFTEGATGDNHRTHGSIGEGLPDRYGIHACIHEPNANWIAGLDAYPNGKNWELHGEQLCEVFYRLLRSVRTTSENRTEFRWRGWLGSSAASRWPCRVVHCRISRDAQTTRQLWMGLHSYCEPGTGERIVDQAAAMLREPSSVQKRLRGCRLATGAPLSV